ncbi:MAG: transporter substrate-binding domain-containing protein [Lachnospiraceae bacterium]|nr:transporter substrate-binding domain-containing protein [Lachnospiraceae bacterium]
MKKLLTYLLCLAMIMGLAGCGGKESPKETTAGETPSAVSEAPKEITVIGTGSFFPVIYTDENGELTGFEHDLVEAIAEKANLKVNWELSDDYGAMFAGLDAGKYDTIAAQISYTDERAKTYNFTDKYTANEIKMCVRADDPAETLDDLQGRTVCISFGTVLDTFFQGYNKDLPDDKKITCIETEGSIYEELKVEHYDAFPITVMSFDEVMKKGEYDFKLIGDPIIIDYQAFPFNKDADPALLEAFNKAMDELRADGTMKALSEKYYGRDFTTFEQ